MDDTYYHHALVTTCAARVRIKLSHYSGYSCQLWHFIPLRESIKPIHKQINKHFGVIRTTNDNRQHYFLFHLRRKGVCSLLQPVHKGWLRGLTSTMLVFSPWWRPRGGMQQLGCREPENFESPRCWMFWITWWHSQIRFSDLFYYICQYNHQHHQHIIVIVEKHNVENKLYFTRLQAFE